MSDVGPVAPYTRERLLTFEVGRAAYALPIEGVIEVAQVGEVACIPMLPKRVAGVANHHGDALPLIDRALLLGAETAAEEEAPEHLLVVSAQPPDGARLGLPVDRILGLVDGRGGVARGPGPVAERRPIEGRLVSVLDAERLLERARQVIEESSAALE